MSHGSDIGGVVTEHVGCRYQSHGERDFGTVDMRSWGSDTLASSRRRCGLLGDVRALHALGDSACERHIDELMRDKFEGIVKKGPVGAGNSRRYCSWLILSWAAGWRGTAGDRLLLDSTRTNESIGVVALARLSCKCCTVREGS